MTEIQITSETVMNLKQAVSVIKEAYRNYCLSLVASNESAILPPLLGDALNLSSDLSSVKESIDNYSKISLDDIERPSSDPLNLSSLSDITKVTGNFSLSPSEYDNIKTELDLMFDGVRRKRPIGSVDISVGGQDEYLSSGSLPASEHFSGESTQIGTFYKQQYKGNFLNALLQECIPCKIRITSINALQPLAGIVALLENDLIARYNDILNQLKGLLTNNDILEDLCSLLNFLNFQCVPDLFGMLSLLNMMILKITDLKLINPTGIFNGILTSLFSGVFTGLNSLLDKYIQLILGPIDCIISSLDTQISKLDVGAALNSNAEMNIRALQDRRRHLIFLLRQLETRRDYLLERDKDGSFVNEDSSVVTVSGNTIVGRDVFAALGLETLSRDQEIENIDQDIEEIIGRDGNGGELQDVETEIKELRQREKIPILSETATKPMKDFRLTLGTSLGFLRDTLVEGSDMINGTLEVIKKELQRLLQGRAFLIEDKVEGARNLQRLARVIGIIRTLISLARYGELCKGTNNMQVIGDFLRSSRGTGLANGTHNYYYGKDENGLERLIVVADDARLELEDVINLDLGDLSEIKRLNNAGILPNLGITLDLNAVGPVGKSSVAFMPLNLCGKNSISTTGDLSNIKKWIKAL